MWDDFIAKKEKFIGCQMIDADADAGDEMSTTLVDIKYNGIEHGYEHDDGWIEFVGEEFSWGGSRQYVGLMPGSPQGELWFSGYGGMIMKLILP